MLSIVHVEIGYEGLVNEIRCGVNRIGSSEVINKIIIKTIPTCKTDPYNRT